MLDLGFLRDIDDNELELMLSWRNAPSVRLNMYTRHEISLDEHLSWWKSMQASNKKKYFMYQLKNVPLGIVALTQIDKSNSNCSWAFYASPNAPRGTGSKMEFLALEYVFSELQLHKLKCEVLAFNTAVIKLHQKFGFQIDGILREEHLMNKQYVDVYLLSMLSSEWKAKRNEISERMKITEKA